MITNPQKNRLANFLYGGKTNELEAISPKTFYIGLSTEDMTANGIIGAEPSADAGYARVPVANTKDQFSTVESLEDALAGKITNQNQITWEEATEAWGTIKTVFLAASVDATEALYYVTVNKTVPANCTLYFKGGDLTLSVSN